jgi:lysophospholipase L1-like esterase
MGTRYIAQTVTLVLLVLGSCVAQDAAEMPPVTPAVDQLPAEPEPLRISLPPDIWAVPGHEINIYFGNVILRPSLHGICIDVECNRGRQDADRWRYVPADEDVGQFGLTIRVTDAQMNLLGEARTMIHVTPADAGAGREISILVVGDSLTANGIYATELFNLCQGEADPKLKMLGTIKGRMEGAAHQGYGGWRWQTFCTHWTAGDDARARSPFLRLEGNKPVLDFQAYCDAENDGKGPDFITVLLGCNDTFGSTEEDIEERIDTMFGYADMLIAEFKRVRPDTQIGILLLVPPADSQDAFGSNYKCGQTRWQYRRNVQRVVERELEKFLGREDENIFIVPANVNLDCANNYPTRTEPINSRNETTVSRASNGVHPAATGYLQIADSIYYWLKSRLNK